ncbi:MAG: ABC transporter permease [Bacteroidetes bacterium]|nr:ABC transporter permease [Bacteroidota bacterium]
MDKNTEWEWEIKPEERWFHLNLKDLIQYKDLLFRFVRRDILISYQQTILGPIWVFLQPLLTTLVYFVIFTKIAKIPTGKIPAILFYLPGTIIWTYFSECLNGTMNTFFANAYIFRKVYFPRLITPLSIILFHSFRLCIQLVLFVLVYLFFMYSHHDVTPSWWILIVPFMILISAVFALGLGLIVSVITAKYRDLDNILQFVLRLFMFAAPVVYPLSIVPEKYKLLFWLNPLTSVIETSRAAFFAPHIVYPEYILLSVISVVVILFVGLTLFRKREIEVMDVI